LTLARICCCTARDLQSASRPLCDAAKARPADSLLHQIAGEAVQLDVAIIARDNTSGRIEQADALRDVVENGSERKAEWKQKRLKS
jgi:hypothetical protein